MSWIIVWLTWSNFYIIEKILESYIALFIKNDNKNIYNIELNASNHPEIMYYGFHKNIKHNCFSSIYFTIFLLYF